CYVLLRMHHIIGDQSLRVIICESLALLAGRSEEPGRPGTYRRHVWRSLEWVKSHDSEAFFREKLAGFDEPTAPFGLLDVHADASRIAEITRPLEQGLEARVRAQSHRAHVSAATLFHTACAVMVARTSGRDEVVFGTVLLGQTEGAAEETDRLGLFINTLPIRLFIREVTVRELVERTQGELIELLQHEMAPLTAAQRGSGIASPTPLFTTLLNFRHNFGNMAEDWDSAAGITVLAAQERTNYPLTISVDEFGDKFVLTVQTDRRIDPDRVAGYLICALEGIVAALELAPESSAASISILPAEERNQIVGLFNATVGSYEREKGVHELFEEQVERTPHAVAASHQGSELTYEELNKRANQLARYLLNRGVTPDQPVGICLARGIEMLIGVLGILKAGGAYVPLDPNYPAERLQYMIEDAAPAVVLTQQEFEAVLPAGTQKVSLRQKLTDISGHIAENLSAAQLGLSSGNLVYIIYTSGSTGRPKGTAMPHRSMVNLIQWHRSGFDSSRSPRVLQFAALSFDVAFQEIFTTLCTGGTLVLLDEWTRRDARALLQLLSAQSINRLFVPPLMLQSLAEYIKTTGAAFPQSLQDVITAGEQLRISAEIVSGFDRLSGCRLHNHYGPTETHVVSALTLAGDPQHWPALPAIGRPISNTQMYVLDDLREPVPIGVA